MRKYLYAIAALALLAGCQSIPPGATAHSAEEIEKQLAGRTWKWSGGNGVYFAPGGSAIVKWKGVLYDTNWTAERGKFCHSTASDDGPFCWLYYEKDGQNWSKSLFQKENRNPYVWDARTETKRGNRL